jgi:hypothetical protein
MGHIHDVRQFLYKVQPAATQLLKKRPKALLVFEIGINVAEFATTTGWLNFNASTGFFTQVPPMVTNVSNGCDKLTEVCLKAMLEAVAA